MKRYSLLLIIAILLVTGCNKAKPGYIDINHSPDTLTVSNADSLPLPEDCVPKGFTTPMGTKIFYTKVGNAVRLSWGDGSYTRSHDSLFICNDYDNVRWDWIPKYVSETKSTLIFKNILSTSSGANPAPIDFSAIILPKNNTDSIYTKDMYLDKHDDYLLYSVGWTGDSLYVLNLETKGSQLCRMYPQPPPFNRSPTFAIHKTKIVKKQLEVLYESLDKNDSVVLLKNKFKLNI